MESAGVECVCWISTRHAASYDCAMTPFGAALFVVLNLVNLSQIAAIIRELEWAFVYDDWPD